MDKDPTEGLTPQQLEALTEVLTVTQAEHPQREVAALRKANWNVQAALQAIFDDAPINDTDASLAGGSAQPTSRIEQMELDDSLQGSPNSRRAPASAYPSTTQPGFSVFRVLAYPFSVTLSLFSFVLRIVGYPLRLVGIPLPRLPPGGLTFFGRLRGPTTSTDDPRTAAMRWVRQLEEETGAVCVGHEHEKGAADEDDKGKEPLNRRTLPNFFLGSYEEALRRAQRELSVLCVVLVSEEHDDVPQFKRTVLTNEDVVKTLTDNNFIVWGGDVRDREAYQASIKLAATTYPLVAFVSLLPPPSSRSSSSSTASQLTVVSRITPLSPTALVTHITQTVLPRTQPFLQRLKNTEAQRVRERQLRAEQDRALEEAMRRDGERIRAARAREREEREKEAAEVERARLRREESDRRERRKADREMWSRYARRMLVPPEPSGGQPGVRVTVRIASGQRRTRTFPSSASVEAIYSWVETLSLGLEYSAAEDPDRPPVGYVHQWDFVLATTFPRVVVRCDQNVWVNEVDVLKGGVVLVVEGTGEGEEDENGSDEDEE